MKHLKTYERASLHHHFYPVEIEYLEEIYEYLYKLGCNPTVYEIPEKWKKIIKKGDYLIYFNNRNINVADYIINRSYAVTTFALKDFKIAEEKEKEMELFINQLKYNL